MMARVTCNICGSSWEFDGRARECPRCKKDRADWISYKIYEMLMDEDQAFQDRVLKVLMPMLDGRVHRIRVKDYQTYLNMSFTLRTCGGHYYASEGKVCHSS